MQWPRGLAVFGATCFRSLLFRAEEFFSLMRPIEIRRGACALLALFGILWAAAAESLKMMAGSATAIGRSNKRPIVAPRPPLLREGVADLLEDLDERRLFGRHITLLNAT
jgi:hypothetical protein